MYGCVALDRESVAKTPYKRRYCTDICTVKEQTKDIITNESGSKVGTITLQYQTEIQGGRPQFLYDKCYLKPNVTTYWSIDESHSEFSGDRIAVYFTFTYWGQFYETAVVYFYPD